MFQYDLVFLLRSSVCTQHHITHKGVSAPGRDVVMMLPGCPGPRVCQHARETQAWNGITGLSSRTLLNDDTVDGPGAVVAPLAGLMAAAASRSSRVSPRASHHRDPSDAQLEKSSMYPPLDLSLR